MEKVIVYKHGVSITGELQVHPYVRYMEGDVIKHEVREKTYSPADVQKMGDFDVKSQQIVEAIYVPDVIQEVQQNIAYYNEKLAAPGFCECIVFDRMIDELWRISIRQAFDLIENGKRISRKYHRSWIMPGSSYANNDVISRRLADVFHTPTVKADYLTAMETAGAFEDGLNGEEPII